MSQENKNLQLGLFGFGCVGQGLYEVLNKTEGIQASIRKIVIKHPEKARSIDADIFSTDPNDILLDSKIDVVVELIDDHEAAFDIVSEALRRGKSVVTANKRLLANRLPQLLDLQDHFGGTLLYEGSCCASIPIVRNLEEYYDNDMLQSVEGILNGSTNYILDLLDREKLDFEPALKLAQEQGYAETDASLDVDGFDPVFKLTLIAYHAFGIFLDHSKILRRGIRGIRKFDLEYARRNSYQIKLLAWVRRTGSRVQAAVLPSLIPQDHALSQVRGVYNAVSLQSGFSEKQVLIGKGAGDTATGAAVLSDISALRYQYRYEYRKAEQLADQLSYDLSDSIWVYVRYHGFFAPRFTDFIEIDERYSSDRVNYLIGRIPLNVLQDADWVEDDRCFILALPHREAETSLWDEAEQDQVDKSFNLVLEHAN